MGVGTSLGKAYGLAQEFSLSMKMLEEKGIGYNDLHNSDLGKRYLEIDETRSELMEHQKLSTITGVLLFTLLNPKQMIKAQRYYGGGFGQPCSIKR